MSAVLPGALRLRRLAKSGVAAALSGSGLTRVLGRWHGGGTPLVLGYHRVVAEPAEHTAHCMASLLIGARMLRQQLEWIGRRYRFVPLDELDDAQRAPRRGLPPAAVTFDDGYQDFQDVALPLLRRMGVPAAVFIVTDLVGTAALQLHDELHLLLRRALQRWSAPTAQLTRLVREAGVAEATLAALRLQGTDAYPITRSLLTSLPQAGLRAVVAALRSHAEVDAAAARDLRALSWEALSAMRGPDLTIGSHTRTHALLTKADPIQLLQETYGARRIAERRLGMSIEHFAYPDGRFDEAAVSAVELAGYRRAYTTCQHRDARRPWLTIPRRLLWEGSARDAAGAFVPALLDCELRGAFDLLRDCGQAHRA